MGVTNMQKIILKLLDMMGISPKVGKFGFVSADSNMWILTLPLGKIDAGTYEGKHWGDVVIDDTDAELVFTVGDVYDWNTFSFGEGTVKLNYAKGNTGLAYTGELEDVVTARIKDLYGIDASGSEQGMQGDDYLSLDLWVDGMSKWNTVTDEELDADMDNDTLAKQLKPYYRFA